MLSHLSIFPVLSFGFLLTLSAWNGHAGDDKTLSYPDILDISHTPRGDHGGTGWFTDHGSWMGFTLPEESGFLNGFCGPYDIDNKFWISPSLVQIGYEGQGIFAPLKRIYYPGHLYMKSYDGKTTLTQKLRFVDRNNAVLSCSSTNPLSWQFSGKATFKGIRSEQKGNQLIFFLPHGECAAVTFGRDDVPALQPDGSYSTTRTHGKDTRENTIVISFFNDKDDMERGLARAASIRDNPVSELDREEKRWNDYISGILRPGRPELYDRIAVKSMVTLVSNWRSAKGALKHDGMCPSHATGNFAGGFWAWDTWQQAVATARFDPELAKSQVRSMFDYQDEHGMIADCIFSNPARNNYRDTKPPLAAWAVYEIWQQDGDKSFLEEMYPKLLRYHQWWYKFRDNDKNGICEFGSTDGSEIAARWESGMDNAVRYDHISMVKNADKAWSMDQESVDLNSYLAQEYRILEKITGLLCRDFQEPERTANVHQYFFDKEHGYFFDKKLKSGDFVKVEGCEGWTPLWTEIALPEQAERVHELISKPTKFSTYIPFPTLAFDHPDYEPNGYWRGPIWLNQVYFGISGLRKYGYIREADHYTDQVFTRLQGLTGNAPIHENYNSQTGERLKAQHFSWSSADLLFLYWEYGEDAEDVKER